MGGASNLNEIENNGSDSGATKTDNFWNTFKALQSFKESTKNESNSPNLLHTNAHIS